MVGKIIGAAIVAATLGMTGSANAIVSHNQDVTPDTFFGSGNSNGNFTVDRSGGVELGIRAKIPFSGLTRSNGDGTFFYFLSEANPRWNFDWTVNTDFDGNNPTRKVNAFTYLLGIDFDPGAGTDFLIFDPITPNTAPLNVAFFDHDFGDNNTFGNDGTNVFDLLISTNTDEYADLIAENNAAQQSWRHAFFPIHPTLTYDPFIEGT